MMRGSSGAAGIVGARMVRESRVAEAEAELNDAAHALGAWESAHELEYKMLFAQGERGELNRLDTEWNELVAERDYWRDELKRRREVPSW